MSVISALNSFKKGFRTASEDTDIDYYDLGDEVFSNHPQLIDKLVVGRDKEAELLGSYLGNCKKKIRKRVLLHGERGIGKSTLTNLLFIENELNSQFSIISFNQISYISALDDFKKIILRSVLSEIAEGLTKRKEIEKSLNDIKTWADIVKDSIITQAPFHELMGRLLKEEDELKFWKYLFSKLKKTTILIFDDYQEVRKDKAIHSFVMELVSHGLFDDFISVFIMQKKEFDIQLKENSILLKDSYILPIGPLEVNQCCELLGKRIIYHRTNSTDKLDGKLDWNKDTLPFIQSGLEQIALHESGNPLNYINAAGDIYSYSMENKIKVIDQKVVTGFYKQQGFDALKFNKISLTDKQKEIYIKLLESKEGLTAEDLSNEIGTGRSNIVQHLLRMLQSGIVYNKRFGRYQRYFAVTADFFNKYARIEQTEKEENTDSQ